MDSRITKYKCVPFGELNYCPLHNICYQRDMTTSIEYGEQYFKTYVSYENTETSKRLNSGRISITEKYCSSLLDIGIGSGEFIKESRIDVYGYDVNPLGVEWLTQQMLYCDPYSGMPDVSGLTFWDSLEHIPDPSNLLDRMQSGQYAFISMPIFADVLKVRKSKHYKPMEHYYYFSPQGLEVWMRDCGFDLCEVSDFESQAGREDIFTFVFCKT